MSAALQRCMPCGCRARSLSTRRRMKKARDKYFVGCSGWFYWKWRGTFYPADLPSSEWFRYYARRFDTVEINASFYSWPTQAGVKA